jgi:hypothetical protein
MRATQYPGFLSETLNHAGGCSNNVLDVPGVNLGCVPGSSNSGFSMCSQMSPSSARIAGYLTTGNYRGIPQFLHAKSWTIGHDRLLPNYFQFISTDHFTIQR